MATANCPSYLCSDIESYPTADSCAKYRGGSNRVILFKCGLDIDLTDGTEIQAAIDNNEAIDYKNVLLNFDSPTIQSAPSYVGCVQESPASYQHSVTFIDRNVTPESIIHYNSANASTGFTWGAALIYQCKEDRWFMIVEPITLQGGLNFPADGTDLQRFEHQLVYESVKASPEIMATNPVFP